MSTVDPDSEVEEGQTYTNIYDIEVKSWVPYPDVVARLTGGSIGLQAEIDERAKSYGTQITIDKKRLYQESSHEYEYHVTYTVDEVGEEPNLTLAKVNQWMIGAILFILGVLVVAVALREVRVTAKESPIALLGLGVIVWKALETYGDTAGQ